MTSFLCGPHYVQNAREILIAGIVEPECGQLGLLCVLTRRVCVCGGGGGGCLYGGVGGVGGMGWGGGVGGAETQCRSVCAESFATKSERFFSHTITISNDQTLILDIIGRRRRIVHQPVLSKCPISCDHDAGYQGE